MKRYFTKTIYSLLAAVVINTSAQAEVISQYTTSGVWASSWTSTAAIQIDVNGNGVNREIYLYAYSGTWGVDYKYWGGKIPADAVSVDGIHGVRVNINTCDVMYNDGCGLIDVTITSEPGYDNFRTRTGVTSIRYANGIILNRVGHLHDRFTNTSGTINGYPISIVAPNWASVMSKTNGMSVTVSTGD